MGARFEIRKTRNLRTKMKQKFYVVTIGRNNEVLQSSEMLSSKQDCYTNIDAMGKILGYAVVEDKTV